MRSFFARLSGFDRLSKRYPASGKLEGPAYARQTVQIGPVRYRPSGCRSASRRWGRSPFLWDYMRSFNLV